MKIETIDKLILKGKSIITNNQNEINPQTSKIAKLWESFYSGDFYNQEENRKIDSLVYGVYSDYESDYKGDFRVTTAVELNKEVENCIIINNQKYLVFSKKGELPQAVIDLWMEIWKYFEENDKYIRAYTIDFEKYLSTDEVEVYIAIK